MHGERHACRMLMMTVQWYWRKVRCHSVCCGECNVEFRAASWQEMPCGPVAVLASSWVSGQPWSCHLWRRLPLRLTAASWYVKLLVLAFGSSKSSVFSHSHSFACFRLCKSPKDDHESRSTRWTAPRKVSIPASTSYVIHSCSLFESLCIKYRHRSPT